MNESRDPYRGSKPGSTNRLTSDWGTKRYPSGAHSQADATGDSDTYRQRRHTTAGHALPCPIGGTSGTRRRSHRAPDQPHDGDASRACDRAARAGGDQRPNLTGGSSRLFVETAAHVLAAPPQAMRASEKATASGGHRLNAAASSGLANARLVTSTDGNSAVAFALDTPSVRSSLAVVSSWDSTEPTALLYEAPAASRLFPTPARCPATVPMRS